jgi:hypothetical protein
VRTDASWPQRKWPGVLSSQTHFATSVVMNRMPRCIPLWSVLGRAWRGVRRHGARLWCVLAPPPGADILYCIVLRCQLKRFPDTISAVLRAYPSEVLGPVRVACADRDAAAEALRRTAVAYDELASKGQSAKVGAHAVVPRGCAASPLWGVHLGATRSCGRRSSSLWTRAAGQRTVTVRG